MLENAIDQFGTAPILALAGLIVGLCFGACAQHSKFCLRAAVADVLENRLGAQFGIWLLVFSVALLSTHAFMVAGFLDVSDARQLAATGSLSGAIIGGLMFGAGMMFARGCASRLLVLSGTGNLRALITGLLLTLVAQASLKGILAPARERLASLWLIEGGEARSLITWLGIGEMPLIAMTALLLGAGLWMARRNQLSRTRLFAAIGVGLAVTLGWVFTYQISSTSFDMVAVSSVSFTGPAMDTLMLLANERSFPFNFGVGLVIGVFIGSGASAILTGSFKIRRFGPDVPMERYLFGAFLMGFGAMLAGGCAVGAGVTGTAIFSLTAWVAIISMWVGALGTGAIMAALASSTNQIDQPLQPAE